MPDNIGFLTKPAPATSMLTRALHAGVPARWATGDEVYGNDPGLRAECEAQRIGYVPRPGCCAPTNSSPGGSLVMHGSGSRPARGRRGSRFYDWGLDQPPRPGRAGRCC